MALKDAYANVWVTRLYTPPPIYETKTPNIKAVIDENISTFAIELNFDSLSINDKCVLVILAIGKEKAISIKTSVSLLSLKKYEISSAKHNIENRRTKPKNKFKKNTLLINFWFNDFN